MWKARLLIALYALQVVVASLAPSTTERSGPVYFPVSLEDFKSFGLRLPAPTRTPAQQSRPLTTTARPTTTTERLPIARQSHAASGEFVTQPPGESYLTNSFYYIPVNLASQELQNLDAVFQDSALTDKNNPFYPKYFSLSDYDEQNGNFYHGEHEDFEGSEEIIDQLRLEDHYISPHPSSNMSDFDQGLVLGTNQHTFQSTEDVDHSNDNLYERRNRVIIADRVENLPNPSYERENERIHQDNSQLLQQQFADGDIKLEESNEKQVIRKPMKTRLVSIRKYTGTKSPTVSSRRTVTSELYSRDSRTSQPTTESSVHSVFVKMESQEKSLDSGNSPLPSGSSTSEHNIPYVRKEEPVKVNEGYRARRKQQQPNRPTATSPKPVALVQRSRSKSRKSSRNRKTNNTNVSQKKNTSIPKNSRSRTNGRTSSRFQYPVYVTDNNAYRAPANIYNADRGLTSAASSTSEPKFIRLENNLYVPDEYDASAIPGEAGKDYPVYHSVPETGFSCEDQHHAGLYADTEAACQVFHICQSSGVHDSFLCPNGTIFNQQFFVCDWWYNFSCDSATSFFSLNELIYEISKVDRSYS